MTPHPPRSDWHPLTKLLHWLIALLIVSMAVIGLSMGSMANGPDKIAIYALHKSLGITLLALVLVRIGWRLRSGSPAPLPSIPRLQHLLARLIHGLLYLLLLALPVSGWVMNSASGFPLQWFGLFNLPALAGRDEALHALATSTHEWLFWGLAVLVLAHAGAAIFHHLFQGDATLVRMLPRGWLRAPSEETSDA